MARISEENASRKQSTIDFLSTTLATNRTAFIEAVEKAKEAKEHAEETAKVLQEQVAELIEDCSRREVMTTTMGLFLLILFIAVTLLVLTAFDRIFALPFSHSSKREVRNLLVGLEDLLLPMGSFPSKLLHPWASAAENYRSNTNSIPLFPETTPTEGASKSNVTPTSNEPTPREGRSKPTHPDEIFFDSLEYLQASNDNTHIDVPGVGVPFPIQDEAEIKFLRGASIFVGEGEDQRLEEDTTTMVKAEEPQEEDSTAAIEEVSTETQSFEKAICDLVDPEGSYGRDLQKIIELVAGTIERQTKAEDRLRCETTRFQRALEDQANEWKDKRGVFDRVINGQNAKLRLTQDEIGDLRDEKEKLTSEKGGCKAKYDRMKDQFNTKLRRLNADREEAEKAAKSAEAGVEGRIGELKKRYNKEKSDAQKTNDHERNTILCSKRMVEDGLTNARIQATVSQQQHDTEIRNKDGTIKQLNTAVRQLELAATVPEMFAASAEKGFQKQLNGLCKAKDEEIDTLKVQLREFEGEIKRLEGLKAQAEVAVRNHERLSDSLKDELTTLRGEKKHIVEGLKLDKSGLKRTVEANEIRINRQERRITELESGKRVSSLERLLGETKKQLHNQKRENEKTKEDAENFRKGLEEEVRKIENSRKGLEEEVRKVEKKNKGLEEEVRKVEKKKKGLEEEVRKVEEQKKELSRKLEEEKTKSVEALRKATEDANDKARQHEKAKNEAVKEAVERLEAERKPSREAQNKATQTESGSPNADTRSADPADPQIGNDANELLSKILNTNDVQIDAMPKALNAPNPFGREIRKARSLKRHTQPEPGVFASGSSTGVQAGHTMGQSQQKNGSPEQQYDPRLFNLHQNVQPQLPTATSQDHAQASSDTATTAVIPEPVPQNNNASSTGPANFWVNNPQTFSLGEQLPLPGLRDDKGTSRAAFAPPSQLPNNESRGRGRVNASKGRQLAHQAFPPRQSVPTLASTQGQQSGTQQQVDDKQQGGSGGPSQQEHRSDKPKGWTDLMENAVIKELRQNNDANIKYLGDFLRLNYDFETDDVQYLNNYLEKLTTEAEAKQSHPSDQPKGWTALMTSFVQDQLKRGQTNTARIFTLLRRTHNSVSTIEGAEGYVEKLKSEYENPVPKMPAGWTDSMTATVRDGLQNGDDMVFTEELVKAELSPQPDDDDENFQNWLKKLESDYKAELKLKF